MSVHRSLRAALLAALMMLSSISMAVGSYTASDVVLRMEITGGFVPFEAHLLRVPTFTLYSDGLAIYRPAPDPMDDSGYRDPLRQVTLSQDQVDELLDYALNTAGLADARDHYDNEMVADASTVVFTVNTADVQTQVSVYALGLNEGPDVQARMAFEDLGGILADFDSWLPDDADVAEYMPPTYLGVFAEEDPESADLAPWPWDDLDPAQLEPVTEAPFFSTAPLAPEQVGLVTNVPSGGVADIYVSAPDGAAYRLMTRPLLPDEVPDADQG
jgi:hypothetical protein